jgi:aminomethyltransferase
MTSERGEVAARTALHGWHLALGARMIEFGGWEMPLRYGSIVAEHQAVRSAVGLFDLSHMGEVWVSGPDAEAGLARALVNDASRLAVGRAQYSLMCAADGGVVDDLIVYRVTEERFLVVPNAANTITVVAELRSRLRGLDANVDDATRRTSLVAVQGPDAAALLRPLTDVDLGALRSYGVASGTVAGIHGLVARTGYTGEDGFELFVAWDDGPRLGDALMSCRPAPVPVGLGARDTLRLEAGMPLYGNELSLDATPFESGVGRFVRLDREVDFVGREALERASTPSAAKAGRALIGLVVRGSGIARHGHPVHSGSAPTNEHVGVVTSGTHSPTLGLSIAMARVPTALAAPGTMLSVAIRDALVPAEVVALPFYRRTA